jgi:protein-tyrosine phosphatase
MSLDFKGKHLSMIDLRSNILHGTDCGPQSFAESLEMCRAAAASGVRTLVATPRWRAGSVEPPLPFEEITRKVERLQHELSNRLCIKFGFVLEFSYDILELADVYGNGLALGGKQHLLISLPSTHLPAQFDEMWLGLQARGFSILIAHPECSVALRGNEPLLSRWALSGIKFQIDAASVAGAYGREVKKFALECLRKYENSIVIASNMRTSTAPSLREASREVSLRVGELRASKIVSETPAKILCESASLADVKSKAHGKMGSLLRSIKQIGLLAIEP